MIPIKDVILTLLRYLRDNTECDELSHRYCGCEMFDEIIALIEELKIK